MGSSTGTTSPGARVGWVDVGKGLSIALVVLHHVVLTFTGQGWAPPVLQEVSATLGTLRMPLFFLASGLFATRVLAGPWRRVLERRVLFFAWLYVLWCVVRYVWFGLLAHGLDLGSWPPVSTLLAQLWLPASALWFIYALAVFALLARVTAAVPGPVRVGAAAVLSAVVGSGVLAVESYAWRSMALNLVFFLLGVDASRVVRNTAAAVRSDVAWPLTAAAGAVFVALTVALRQPDVAAVPGSRLLTSVVALVAGVGLAVGLARTRAGRGPRWLGARTLEVYLLHGLLVGAFARLVAALEPGSAGTALGAVAVLLTAAAAILGCVAAAGRLRAIRAGWLFVPPWHDPPQRRAEAASPEPLPTPAAGPRG